MVLLLKRERTLLQNGQCKKWYIKRKITIVKNRLLFCFVLFRYRCLQCFNFDMCQQCFYMGCTKKKHKLKHPIQEYCLSVSPDKKKKNCFLYMYLFSVIYSYNECHLIDEFYHIKFLKTTTKVDTKAFLKTLRNNISKKHRQKSRRKYLPVVAESHLFSHTAWVCLVTLVLFIAPWLVSCSNGDSTALFIFHCLW